MGGFERGLILEEPLIAARAKERQESGINQYSLTANLPEASKGETRDELAEMAGVSARNISKRWVQR